MFLNLSLCVYSTSVLKGNRSAEAQVSVLFFSPPSKCAGIYGGKTNIKRLLFSERLLGKAYQQFSHQLKRFVK